MLLHCTLQVLFCSLSVSKGLLYFTEGATPVYKWINGCWRICLMSTISPLNNYILIVLNQMKLDAASFTSNVLQPRQWP